MQTSLKYANIPSSRRPSANPNCRVLCMGPANNGAVLCSHCSLIAHSKCAGRAALSCDLHSKLLVHAQFVCSSRPSEFFYTLAEPPSCERELLPRQPQL
ncbi:hypothetical protein V8E53_004057 [Lactarius tabidus]